MPVPFKLIPLILKLIHKENDDDNVNNNNNNSTDLCYYKKHQ